MQTFFQLNDQNYYFNPKFSNEPNTMVYIPQSAYYHYMNRHPHMTNVRMLPQNIVETFGYTNTFIIDIINEKLAENDYNIENIDTDILNEFYRREIVNLVNISLNDSVDTFMQHIQEQDFGKDINDLLLRYSTNLIIDEMIINKNNIEHVYYVTDTFAKAKAIFNRQYEAIKKSRLFVDFSENEHADDYFASINDTKIVLRNLKSGITYQLVIATYIER